MGDTTDSAATINLRKKLKKKVKTLSASSSSSSVVVDDDVRNSGSFTGDLEDSFDDYKVASSDPSHNRNRRAIALNKKDDSWGFTLQTYGIHQKDTNTLEVFTFVDYVEFLGAAHVAGMRPGDVILAINGKSMESADHETLVQAIKHCEEQMRMVVLFEDCVRKVDLHRRYLKLKKIMDDKMKELKELERKEKRILEVCYNRKDHGSMNNQLGESYSSFDSSWSGDSTSLSSFSEFSAELGSDIVPIQGRLCASMSLGNITNMQGHRSPRIPLLSSPALSASPLTKRRQFLNTSNQQMRRGGSSPCLVKKNIDEDFPTRILNRNLSKSYEQKVKSARPESLSSNSSVDSQNYLEVTASLVKSASFSEGTEKLATELSGTDFVTYSHKMGKSTYGSDDNVFIDAELKMPELKTQNLELQYINEEDEVTFL